MLNSLCQSNSNFYFLPTWSQSSLSSTVLSHSFTLDQLFWLGLFPFGQALSPFVCNLGGLCLWHLDAGRDSPEAMAETRYSGPLIWSLDGLKESKHGVSLEGQHPYSLFSEPGFVHFSW